MDDVPVNFLAADADASPLASLTSGSWTHVAVTVNGTAVQLYLNGSLAYSSTADYVTQVTTDPLEIGLDFEKRFFDGSIDDARLYDRDLEPNEIQELYVAP